MGGDIDMSSDEGGMLFTVWLPYEAGESDKENEASGGERTSDDV